MRLEVQQNAGNAHEESSQQLKAVLDELKDSRQQLALLQQRCEESTIDWSFYYCKRE